MQAGDGLHCARPVAAFQDGDRQHVVAEIEEVVDLAVGITGADQSREPQAGGIEHRNPETFYK